MPNIGQQHSIEKSRQLQRNLYLAAKKDKQRRFHALYDRIFRLDILWRAWKEVRENKGSAGVVRQINRCFSLQIKTDILMLNAA